MQYNKVKSYLVQGKGGMPNDDHRWLQRRGVRFLIWVVKERESIQYKGEGLLQEILFSASLFKRPKSYKIKGCCEYHGVRSALLQNQFCNWKLLLRQNSSPWKPCLCFKLILLPLPFYPSIFPFPPKVNTVIYSDYFDVVSHHQWL